MLLGDALDREGVNVSSKVSVAGYSRKDEDAAQTKGSGNSAIKYFFQYGFYE